MLVAHIAALTFHWDPPVDALLELAGQNVCATATVATLVFLWAMTRVGLQYTQERVRVNAFVVGPVGNITMPGGTIININRTPKRT